MNIVKIRELIELESEARNEQRKFFDAMLEDEKGYIDNRIALQNEMENLNGIIIQEQGIAGGYK